MKSDSPRTPIALLQVDHADAVLRRLQNECFPGDEKAPTSIGHWWIATDPDGEAIAFAGMVPAKSWPGCFYLSRAGVLPAFRGRGLQRRLIRARLAKARRLGGTHAISAAMAWNVHSTRNLIACGFRPYWPNVPWLAAEGTYWHRGL